MKTTMFRALLGVSALALGFAVAGQAGAATAYCSDAEPFDRTGDLAGTMDGAGLFTSDLTFTLDATADTVVYQDANDCWGVGSGNDNSTKINALAKWYDEDAPWDLLVKSDGKFTEEFNKISFEIGNLQAGTEGVWTLSWTGDTNDFPLTIDLVGVLKGGNAFAAYLFEGLTLESNGDGGGTFYMRVLNNGGQVADVSHLSLYVRVGEDDTPLNGDIPVPEPATMALFGGGLLALGWAVRRRRDVMKA